MTANETSQQRRVAIMGLTLRTGALGEPNPDIDAAIAVRLAASDFHRFINGVARKPQKPVMVPGIDHGGERHKRISHGGFLGSSERRAENHGRRTRQQPRGLQGAAQKLMSRLPGHEFRQERISSFDMAFPSSR